jgi:pimeloyl-ACP methyl ester carboxylesterase
MNISPFKVEVPQAVLNDLRDRLARTRWPDEITGSGWSYGTNLSYLKQLADYWRTQYDWRAQEEAINRFHHFRTEVEGLGIHFIHERGQGPTPMPLIITHGWPSSFYQMHKIIPMLANPAAHGGDPADAFDVIVPSIPGYGFSDRPAEPGMASPAVSRIWVRLMVEGLGYDRFAAQGGDIGTGITTRLGLHYPEHIIGLHLTDPAWPYRGPGSAELSEAERRYVEEAERWEEEEGAYQDMQSTKPQTLAYGLNDSPAALAAWIVEKFRAWSDCDGDVERAFTRDELLTNITIYWVTETINSSIRYYRESTLYSPELSQDDRVTVPTAVALFPKDIDQPPREWAERTYTNLQRWTTMPRGGHFAALEAPELLVEDIRAFFRPLRAKPYGRGMPRPRSRTTQTS